MGEVTGEHVVTTVIDDAARIAMLVPESTKQNFAQEVRRAAIARGVTVAESAKSFIDRWRTQHEGDARGGFDVLATWLESAIGKGENDLAEYLDRIDPIEAAKVRALETAKRDLNQAGALIDHPDVIASHAQTAAANASGATAPIVTPDGEQVVDAGTSTDGVPDTTEVAPPVDLAAVKTAFDADAAEADDAPVADDPSTPDVDESKVAPVKAARASKASSK